MSRGVVASLRDFVPMRPLSRPEAYRIAELQAIRFLSLASVQTPPVPVSAISSLPKLQVQRLSPLPVSGATEWSHGRWLILLNGGEPVGRQRFSLAHEFKHILDHRFLDLLYHQIPAPDRHDFIEGVCDYFASSLLVPRPWLKRAWGDGMQNLSELARHFGVSQVAMQVRLTQVGLGERPTRCGNGSPGWRLQWTRGAGSRKRYHRTAALLPN